jgi:very-short-patch-repair endonuclease
MAAVLAGGPGTAVSHRSALELHGIMPFAQLVEVVTPRPRRFRTEGEVTIHTSMVLPEEDSTVVDGIVVATVERALLDGGAVVSDRKVQYCVDAAVRLGLTDHEQLARLLAARRKKGRRGVGSLKRALEQSSDGAVPESRYERAALTIVRDFGLEEPILQYVVVLPSGRKVRIDLAWPPFWLGVEIDGHGYHSTRSERAYDAERDNELSLVGWNMLHFTTGQVFKQPGLVGNTIWRALQTAKAKSDVPDPFL